MILAWMLAHGTAGSSVYSFEPRPECGVNPAAASCDAAARSCAQAGPLCAAPRWSAHRGAWVVPERRAAAEARWRAVSRVLVRTAGRLVSCRGEDGSVDEGCVPVRWGGGKGQVRELAAFAAAVSLHESGWREDVQVGAPPMGRGPGGEVCLMQVMPDQVAPLALWLPKAERDAVDTRPEQQALAATLTGRDDAALGRCFEVGMRALARARGQCKGDAGTFAAYGTGGRCSAASAQWVADRVRSLESIRKALREGEKRP